MKHIKSIATGIALGSMGVLVMSTFSGCENSSHEEKKSAQNKFLVIEQLTNGKYIVAEELPTEGPTRAIIRQRDENGTITERMMSEDEMKKLAQQEYEKFQSGSSELSSHEGDASAGMGLASTILAVAAGSLLGNMIGNALMNNKTFASKASGVATSPISKSPSSSTSSSTTKSYFGDKSSSSASKPTSTSSSSFGG